MNTRPSRRPNRALLAIIGGAAAITVIAAGQATAADTPTTQIVMMDQSANLAGTVRNEQARGNDVTTTFRAVGKGFVAELDKADIARLEANPDVLVIEADRPMHTTADTVVNGAPANDPFAAPTAVSGSSGTATLTTVGATREAGEPAHGASNGQASVWFTWTAPASGTLQVTTAGSTFDTLLAAYTGSSLQGLTQLAANDDANGGLTSAISINVTAGTTYRFAVDGWGGHTGGGQVSWALQGVAPAPSPTPTPTPAPANDAFTQAITLTGNIGTTTGTTTGATREAGEPGHGGQGASASAWYRWTAPASGILTVTTEGSPFDTLLGVYTGGAVGALGVQGDNDDAQAGVRWSQVQVPVVEGTAYSIAVDGWNGQKGATTLNWSLAPTAAPTPAPNPGPTPAPTQPGSGTSQDRAALSWGQDRIDQANLPLDGRIAAALDGAGVTAYVIDTGVRADHQEFGGRVQGGYDAVAAGSDGTTDCNGHGTHVAGTVAGAGYGVAPAANVVPVRVLDCNGSGSTSGVIAGINWAVAHHQVGQPAVANMSLGGGYSATLNAAVASAVADGITFAVAAGNSNADACQASPASEPSALTVGATESNDARAYYSNFGSCLDVFAPGSGILSASPTSTTASRTLSGTSMASPHVAGAAALLLSGTPSATPQSVMAAITQGATQGAVSDVVGSPNRLLNIAQAQAPTPAPTPSPTPTPTPSPTPTPAPGNSGGHRRDGGGTPSNPADPGTPGRVGRRDVLAAPRLVSATRGTRSLTVRITTSAGATGYQVFVNGRMAGRITGARGTVRKAVPKGAKVQVRAVSPTDSSALSNALTA